ncbi:Hypothetical predicted protein, partial [Olea europaea subsp. europaea]
PSHDTAHLVVTYDEAMARGVSATSLLTTTTTTARGRDRCGWYVIYRRCGVLSCVLVMILVAMIIFGCGRVVGGNVGYVLLVCLVMAVVVASVVVEVFLWFLVAVEVFVLVMVMWVALVRCGLGWVGLGIASVFGGDSCGGLEQQKWLVVATVVVIFVGI